jgi:hypothetical protein
MGLSTTNPKILNRMIEDNEENLLINAYKAVLNLVEKAVAYCPNKKEVVVQFDNGRSLPRIPFPDYATAFNDADPIDLTDEEQNGGAAQQRNLDNAHVVISEGEGSVDPNWSDQSEAELNTEEEAVLRVAFTYRTHQTRSTNDVQFPIPIEAFRRLRVIPAAPNTRPSDYWFNDQIIWHYMILLSQRDERKYPAGQKSYFLDSLGTQFLMAWKSTGC